MGDIVLAVGDIAGPAESNEGSTATATLLTKLITAHPRALVLVLGDNAYDNGTADEYAEFYGPIWGADAIAARVRACPGNHDYHTQGARPYFAHFGERAGPADRRGFYSFDHGAWHVVS